MLCLRFWLEKAETATHVVVSQQARVVRVVDGDTFVAEVQGENRTIRLIGMDCPESVNPDKSKNTEAGKEASRYTKETLQKGRIVYLEYDRQTEDIYGRTLAYAWLVNPESLDTGDCSVLEQDLYNAELVWKGYAVPKVYQPNTRYAWQLDAIFQNRKEGDADEGRICSSGL